MANEVKPLFRPGANVTVRATASVTGGRFIVVSAEYDGNFPVAHAGDGAKPFGVAASDIADGEIGAALRGGIVPVTAGGSITAGQRVQSDGAGRAVSLTTGTVAGVAVEDGSAGIPVFVALSIS